MTFSYLQREEYEVRKNSYISIVSGGTQFFLVSQLFLCHLSIGGRKILFLLVMNDALHER